VTVEAAGDLVENDSTFHSDIDRDSFIKMPLESGTSAVSAAVTQSTPGVAADSNGLFHGLGDHAENSFSVDGQPITDQQSKVFSNQIPLDSVQSLEVISGAPPAEYGGKTSVSNRSHYALGTGRNHTSRQRDHFLRLVWQRQPAGRSGLRRQKLGKFHLSVNGLNTGRFLDPPEFTVLHDKGNEENLFDRVDYQLSSAPTQFT
jgi:hypothetical protein